jgi:hypothetical protein
MIARQASAYYCRRAANLAGADLYFSSHLFIDNEGFYDNMVRSLDG